MPILSFDHILGD